MRCGNSTSLILVVLLLAVSANSQDLPEKIRGYSVYRAGITISQTERGSRSPSSDTVVKFGEPFLKDASLTGVTLELPVQVNDLAQSGRVDFLAFYDVRVNGISVRVDEYRTPFTFRKGESITLPVPAVVFVPTGQIVKTALGEMDGSKREWTVTGRIFVFGKFRKFGFEHKRVVPVDISLKIPNPLIS